MILYNVTVSLDPEIEADWVQWITEEHIPDMLATGKFVSAQLIRIKDDQQQPTGNYAVQYKVENQSQMDAYLNDDAARLRGKTQTRFGNKVLAFRTFLELLDEQS